MNIVKLKQGQRLLDGIEHLEQDIKRIEEHGSTAVISLMWCTLSGELASVVLEMVLRDLRLQLKEAQEKFDSL